VYREKANQCRTIHQAACTESSVAAAKLERQSELLRSNLGFVVMFTGYFYSTQCLLARDTIQAPK